MKKLLSLLMLLSIGSILTGCKKESGAPSDTPNYFIEALHNKDANLASREVRPLLKQYSESNLQILADTLSSTYKVKATMLPFNMIQTLPAQTEIMVEYTYRDSLETRLMDMYGDDNNRTVLSNIHE